MLRIYNSIILVLFIVAVNAQPSLKPHPRLLVLDEDLPVILKAISVDSTISLWYTKVIADADAILVLPPTQWVSGRMLTQSRQVLSRVSTLAGVFRLTSNVAYANRAIEEMLVAAQMPGWCPNSFLDPSEMTNALAIGYDWLYNLMNDTERTIISSAIYDKGLRYGVEFYLGNYTQDPDLQPTPLYPSGFDWTTVFFNWNQVCNGGMLMGALAVWEEYPSIAELILNSSIPSIEISISAYAPDGGWVESPTYGDYASNYAAYYLGALYSVFGNDYGIIERHPYLGGYGNFHMNTISPGGVYDSWGDSGLIAGADHSMIFYGHLFNNSQYIAYERTFFYNNSGIDIFHVMLSHPDDAAISFDFSINTTALFRGAEILTARNYWAPELNQSSFYAAFKGGNTTMIVNPHQHLDLGNFIFEVDGSEIITDLGADNYSLPGYFNVTTRFNYYLTSSIGHNVYTINGNSNQQMSTAQVEIYEDTPNYISAGVDLTSAYAPNISSAHRYFSVDLAHNHVQLFDFIVPNSNTKDLTWRLHSKTVIDVTNQIVTFTPPDSSLPSVQAILVIPPNATVSTFPYNPPPPEYQTANLHVLEVTVPSITEGKNIEITITFMVQ